MVLYDRRMFKILPDLSATKVHAYSQTGEMFKGSMVQRLAVQILPILGKVKDLIRILIILRVLYHLYSKGQSLCYVPVLCCLWSQLGRPAVLFDFLGSPQ